MRNPVFYRQFHQHGWLALIVLVALNGCMPSDSVEQWVASEKARKGAPLQPLPTTKDFDTFLYKAQEMRDPFGLSAEELADVASSGPRPPTDHVPEVLESYPLDGLKMSGTLGSGRALEGLVRDPDGIVHRIKVGNYLGQNYGRITAISEDRIDLVELVPNGAGGWMERQSTIALGETKP